MGENRSVEEFGARTLNGRLNNGDETGKKSDLSRSRVYKVCA